MIDTGTKFVFPDIIVYGKRDDEPNLFVIEVFKSTNKTDRKND